MRPNIVITSNVDAANPMIIRKIAKDAQTGQQIGEAIAVQYPTNAVRYATRNFLTSYATNEWTPYSGLHAKSHIQLEKLNVEKPFQRRGVGRELVRSVVRDSFERNCDGRVIVTAQNFEISPLPFYRKLGFASGDMALDKKIDRFLESPFGKFRECTEVMMIPKKVAKKFVRSV